MSASSSNSNNSRWSSSSLKMEREEAKLIEKQGIVSILGSDCERAKAASLRRTLSADMSSRKWLAQHGFPHMKKIASSQQFMVSCAADSSSSSPSSSSEGEDEYEERPAGMFQTWSSILSQKNGDEALKSGAGLPVPYVHPLMKRSSSSLSEKSLQICTESLGSETGSDGFSSSPASNTVLQEDKQVLSEQQREQSEQGQLQQQDYENQDSNNNSLLGKEELTVVVEEGIDNYYSHSVRKRLEPPPPPSSFPPPLPSLSATQGPNLLRFQSHRRNGRLVLEAVSVPTQNYFQAQRHGGRLVLTLADNIHTSFFDYEDMTDLESESEEAEDLGEEYENSEKHDIQMDEDENGEAASEEEAKMMVTAIEEAAGPKLPTGMINVHRSALMMKKLMGLVNINPTWPPKLNKAANLEEATPLPPPPPPPPRVARLITTTPAGAGAASSFNAYDYCWRSKPPTASTVLNKTSKQGHGHEQQQLLLLRGNKAEYSVSLLRGCKEPKRSLLIWEPYCIATS